MTHDDINAEFHQIVQEDGPWTAGSFEIAPGLWTMPESPWRRSRAAFALRNASLFLGKPPDDPDARPAECGLLQYPFQHDVHNPSTQRITLPAGTD